MRISIDDFIDVIEDTYGDPDHDYHEEHDTMMIPMAIITLMPMINLMTLMTMMTTMTMIIMMAMKTMIIMMAMKTMITIIDTTLSGDKTVYIW